MSDVMSNRKQLQGIIAAVVTPVDQQERFQTAAFERLLERLFAARVDGVYVCGQTGECAGQPLSQRRLVAEAAVRNCPPGRTTIVHVAAHSTAAAIDLARHAARIGATAVSSLPPIGLGDYSFAEIRSYYKALAAACDLPLLIYYHPELCASVASPDHVFELCGIPNVSGLKFTSLDLFLLSRLKRETSVVLNGRDEVLAPSLLMGADGGIGAIYNLAPEVFVQIYESAQEGNWERARQLQCAINDLIALIMRFPMVAAVKATLGWAGIRCGPPIAPTQPLTTQQESELFLGLSGWESTGGTAFRLEVQPR